MAYKKLAATSLSNPTETFRHFRDFMCKLNGIVDYTTLGIGWTYHDSFYSARTPNYGDTTGYNGTINVNDYFVMYSAGEDGNRQLYFKVTYDYGYIHVQGYLYWDNSAHTGYKLFGAANNWVNTVATNNVLQIYADLDAFAGIAKYGSYYYSVLGGWCPDSRIDTTVTTIGASISSGSNVTVTFASVPAGWAIGKKVFMHDNTNIERVIIDDITGTNIRFANIVATYSSGAKFYLEDTVYISSGNVLSTYYRRIGNNGIANDSFVPWVGYAPGVSSGDGLDDTYPCMPVYFVSTTALIGPVKNLYASQNFTSETTHTVGAAPYTFILLYYSLYALLKEP